MENQSNNPIPIGSLKETHLQQMEAIFESARYREEMDLKWGFVHDPIQYRKLVAEVKIGIEESRFSDIGRVFFEFGNEGEVLGFLLSFDSMDINSKKGEKFPIQLISRHLTHEANFIKDLYHIGHFCFMSQIITKTESKGNGIGSRLIDEYLKYYSIDSNSSPIISGGVVHEKQYKMLRWLARYDVLFLDFYFDPKKAHLWFRTVKILKLEKFYEGIKNVLKTFPTVIPIQLNLATKSLNEVLKPLGARVIWPSFFQYEPTRFSRNVSLDKYYNGFYSMLLSCPESEYFDTVATLKEVINYLNKKDKVGEDKVASISKPMAKKGFELFFVNDDENSYQFPDFGNPIILNLEKVRLTDLLDKKEKIGLGLGLGFYNEKNSPLAEYEAEGLIDYTENNWRTKINDLARNKDLKKLFSEPQKLYDTILNTETLPPFGQKYKKGVKRINNATWLDWIERKLLSIEDMANFLKIIEKYAHSSNGLTDEEKDLKETISKRPLVSSTKQEQWEYWIELHRRNFQADQVDMQVNEKWCHAIIPISFAEGLSGIIFTLIFEPKHDKPDWLNHLALTVSSTLSKNMFNIITRLQKVKMNRSIMKYATSTISTRNLAHNTGSHILSKLTSQKNIEKFIDYYDGKPSYEHITRFAVYLQTRMDYLADIGTSEPLTAISGGLNERLIKTFNENKIVVSLISGTNLEKVKAIYSNQRSDAGHFSEDINIQIPNGNLGVHAFYVVLENIIRNAVKHSQQQIPKRGLEINVVVKDFEQIKLKQRGYRVIISDNIPKPKIQVKVLCDGLNKRYINSKTILENKKIRPYAWGLSEIKIAAAYLRKKIPSEFLDPSYDKKYLSIPLLNAVIVEDSSDDTVAYLGYEIYVKKPRKMIIVDSNGKLINDTNRRDWINQGVKILTIKELIEEHSNQLHSHAILVHFEDTRTDIEWRKNFPLRWIQLESEIERIKLKRKLEKNIEKAFSFLWKKWGKRFLNNKNFEILPRLNIQMDDGSKMKKLKQDELLFLYDHHGRQAKGKNINPSNLGFYESFGSSSLMGRVLEDYKGLKGHWKKRLKWELIEAAVTDIIVLDERIQKEVFENHPSPNYLENNTHKILEWMRIFIPDTSEIDLSKEELSESDKDIVINWLKNHLESRKIDFCLIHLGIIERIGGTQIEEINQFIKRFITGIDGRAEVVIVSGRGKPHQLPEKSLFLNYSNIARYLLVERSKFHLCKMLFSARTRLESYEV
ncbi:MAG: hypothetical protein NXI23_26365 [Bacteroidetes bacterium]|nr:hypothetical protein [Bacteroidota bacterium]